MQYKPAGYNSLSPYFIVKDAQKMVELLQTLFDATVLRRFDRPDGTIMHIELKIDDSVLMMGEASEEFPPVTHVLHLYVSDVDDVFNRAMALGCTPIEKPSEREGDPDRRGTFKDFAGNMWSIGTQSQ